MATASTQAAWRSFGGDTTKTAYAGDMQMVADFYVPFGQQTANTAVQVSSTVTTPVQLPAGAVVYSVELVPAVTGGTTPTLNLGLRVNSTGTNTATALLSGTAAVSTKIKVNLDSGTAGANLGTTSISTASLATLTGALTGTPTGGSLTGRLYYYVPNGGAATA
jgi:hypothetical protein